MINSPYQPRRIRKHWSIIIQSISNHEVSTAPVDGLAWPGARVSAGTVMTDFGYVFIWDGTARADSRLVPSQWETSLQSNAVSHWLAANLESALAVGHNRACPSFKGKNYIFSTIPSLQDPSVSSMEDEPKTGLKNDIMIQQACALLSTPLYWKTHCKYMYKTNALINTLQAAFDEHLKHFQHNMR